MSFDMPGNMPHFKGNKKGRAYLTTHRVSVTQTRHVKIVFIKIDFFEYQISASLSLPAFITSG